MAKDKPFNNPFGALKLPPSPGSAPAAKPQPAAKPASKPQQVSVDDESALFLSAMGAYEPVKPVTEPPAPAVTAEQRQQAAAEDVESLLELAELTSGDGDLQVEHS